jgi:glycerophosphoryl diester phosphodiesterase
MAVQLFAKTAGRPLISAHRGFSAKAPENTLAALEAALEAGADVAEVDLRMTRDGHLVLMHDRSVDRTTGGRGRVSDLTLDEVRRLDAGAWFAPEFAGVAVPTLEEALRWSKGRLGFLLELKNYPERQTAFLSQVIRTIEQCAAEDFVLVAGFDHVTLAEVKARRPTWPLEMIYHCRLADPAHAARACGAALASLEPEFCLPSDVEALHGAGVAVLTTVLSLEHGRELSKMGVDFFESDDVELAVGAARAAGGGG